MEKNRCQRPGAALPMTARDAVSMQTSIKGLVGAPPGSFTNMGAWKCPNSQHMSRRLAFERERILRLSDARYFLLEVIWG